MKEVFYIKAIGLQIITLCTLFLCACHKEDADAYTMNAQDFMISLLKEQAFQMALTERLGKNPSRKGVEETVNARKKFSADYILEIHSLNFSSQIPSSVSLSAEQSGILSAIDQKSGSSYEEELLKRLIDSDQGMITFHVKAASSSGVSDGLIRNWAKGKLPALRANLSQTQDLK